MLERMITLAYHGLGSGGDIGNFLFNLEQMGVFTYLLPFLLIFALIYGILTNVKLLGDNRAINAVLSIAIALMALQFNFVGVFFSEIFPRLGVGLSIILVVLVLLGSFINFNDSSNKWIKWVFGSLAGIIAIIIIFQSLGRSFPFFGFGFFNFNYFMGRNGGIILLLVITGAIVLGIIFGGRNRGPAPPTK